MESGDSLIVQEVKPLRVCSAALLLALAASAADTRPYVDSDPAELARTIPELSGLRSAPEPERLGETFRALAAALSAGFRESSVVEEIHEMRFEDGGIFAASRRERARYAIARTAAGWQEVRTELPAGGPTGFFVTGGFLELLSFLLPDRPDETRYRYLGQMTEGGQEALVMACLRPAGTAQRQGLIWIDAATKRVLRVRLSLLDRVQGVPLETWSTDIRLTPSAALSQVTVSGRVGGSEVLTVHRFAGANVGEEPLEQMARAIALTQEGKTAEAAVLFKEAQRRDPQCPAIRFHLGAALLAAGDKAAAEIEWRAVVKALPDSAAAHNALGIALYQRGDVPGATAEFQESVRLKPDDAMARENLAKAQAAGETIRVDVRQVIVPVVVTRNDGHFVTDLKQADFQILEDGVEQKITSFSVESSGLRAELTKTAPMAQPSATPAATAPRRSYLICFDTLHSSFFTFNQVRQSLIKLLRAEKKGDSQYALIAVGATSQVVHNMTPDPELVLRAVEDRAFQKTFQGSRASSAAAELEQFERVLSETRTLCDNRQPMCDSKRATLPSMAAEIGEADRVQTVNYLRQLSSLVEQLGRTGGRRTMVLISAGFQMSPGRDAHELLAAYFPEIRGVQLRTMERMQDALEPVFRLAAKNNVPIHTIDSGGLYTSSYQESSRSSGGGRVGPSVERALNRNAAEAGATLQEIAAATGGTSFRNNNDLFAGMTRAFADGRDYYVLSYVPANAIQDGKFRAITVRVRDSKMVILAKRGYWAAGQ